MWVGKGEHDIDMEKKEEIIRKELEGNRKGVNLEEEHERKDKERGAEG